MARLRERIRTIKPEIRRSQSLASCSLGARLTFHLLITLVDDSGRFEAVPALLRADLYPLNEDISSAQVMDWCEELEEHGMVSLYEVDGRPYGEMTNWHHQKIERPTPSDLPDPKSGVPRESSRLIAKDREASRLIAPVPVSGPVPGSVPGPETRLATKVAAPPATDAVGVYVEACRGLGLSPPDSRSKARVGAEAKRLISEGKPEDIVAEACRELARRGTTPSNLAYIVGDVERQRLGIDQTRRRPATIRKSAVALALDQFTRELQDAATVDGSRLGDGEGDVGQLLAGPGFDAH